MNRDRRIGSTTRSILGILLSISSPELRAKDVSASVGGRYNVDLTTVLEPRDEQSKKIDTRLGEAFASVREGGISGSARAVTDGNRLSVGISLGASPSAGLGSKIFGRALSETYEVFRFHAARDDIRGLQAVVRLRGRISFSEANAVDGYANATLSGFFQVDPGPENSTELFDAEWSHYVPTRMIAERIDKTGTIDLEDDQPNLLVILFSPTTYTLGLKLATYLDCTTGHDSKGNVLAANASLSLGATQPGASALRGLRSGKDGPDACFTGRANRDGASVVGLRFVDAQGNVLDLAPGDVAFEAESGLEYPVLGSSLPWLSGGDNFDDNARNAEQWEVSSGNGVLNEKDFSLEYSAPVGVHSAHWAVKGMKASLQESWEVRTDVHLEPLGLTQTGDAAAVGIRVSAGAHMADLRLERRFNAGVLERRFRATQYTAGSEVVTGVAAPQSEAAVKLSYNPLTEELRYWYDANGAVGGYAWTLLHTIEVGSAGWGLTKSTLLLVEIGGESSGPAVSAGNAWLDNFNAGSWEPVMPHFDHVARSEDGIILSGCAEPWTPLKVESSTDLTAWGPAGEVTASEDGVWELTRSIAPASPQHYYRLRH